MFYIITPFIFKEEQIFTTSISVKET